MYAIYYDRVKVVSVNGAHQLGLSSIPPVDCRVKLFQSPKDALNFLKRMGMETALRVQRLSVAPYPPSARLKPVDDTTRANPRQASKRRVIRSTADLNHFAGFEGA